MLKRLYLVMAVSFIFSFSACSQSDLRLFQDNNPTPDFTVFTIMDGYEGLEELWDSIDSKGVNAGLSDSIKNNHDEFINFSQLMTEIFNTDAGGGRNPLQNLLGETSGLLDWMTSTEDAFYYNDIIDSLYSGTGNGGFYQTAFYSFLEKASGSGDDSGSGDILGIARTFMQYIVDTKDAGELRDFMESLVGLTQDADFQEDFIDLSKTLSTLLIRADYPMWVDGSGNLITDPDDIDAGDINLELGNAVKGTQALILALSRVMMHDDASKEVLFDIMREGASLVTTENSQKLKQLVSNLEDYFTVGGEGFSSDYNTDSTEVYINSELKTSLREMWPALQKLLVKAGKSGAILHDSDGDDSPIDVIVKSFNQLKNNDINFSEYDISESLDRMIRYDANGKDRTVDGSNMSYLDHLIFVLMASGTVGYKDGGDTGEGNYGHGHGAATGGVLTLNDCLFSLTSGSTLGMNTYGLCLDSPEGTNIHRRASSFTVGQRGDYQYYMYPNYPANLLLSGNCVGDAAIPNGGSGLGTADHYITYWPKDPIGVGELNTARWVLGWLARVVWSGEGPYYYAPDDAVTIDFDIDNADNDGNDATGTERCRVYRRADGRIYAYVYKPSGTPSDWVYYYPKDGENDADEDGDGQRDNRYKYTWNTDYYMIYNGTGLMNSGGYKYYVPGNMNGTATSAGCYTITEKIPEKSASRECVSQEEAMFRNYQWLANEKRFTYVMPLRIQAISCGSLGADFATAFVRIEGNGLQGLANARKGTNNGYWCLGSNNNAGDVPAAGRIAVELKAGFIINLNLIWGTILGDGHVLPDIAGANFGPVQRMGFLVEDMIASADAGADGPYWENRSKMLPLMAALMGELRKHTYYDKQTSSGYTYNDSADNRYPFKTITDGLLPALAKPMYYYQKNSGDYPRNCWKPRINTTSATYLRPDNDDPESRTDPEYAPKQNRTLLSLLSENSYKSLDGLMLILGETRMVPLLLAFLQNLGAEAYDDPAYFDINNMDTWGARRQLSFALEQIATTVKATKTDAMNNGYIGNMYESWQFVTGSGTYDATMGEYSDFTGKRDVDLVLDKAIYGMIGYGNGTYNTTYPGKGLAAYPDTNQWKVKEPLSVFTTLVTDTLAEKPDAGQVQIWLDNTQIGSADASGNITGSGISGTGTVDYTTKKINFILNENPGTAKVTCTYRFYRGLDLQHNWEGFDEMVDTMEEFVDADGQYAILERLIAVMESALSGGGEDFTAEEVAGLTYTLGKLLAYYDADADGGDGAWVYQGQDGFNNLYNMLAVHLPAMHSVIREETGSNYAGMLVLMADMLKEDGMVESALNSAHTQAGWEELLTQTRDLLAEINDPGSRFNAGNQTLWDVLSSLLEDLGNAVQDNYDGGDDALRQLYKEYGFQYNG